MIARALAPVAKQAAKGYPLLAITGPRQSGKTTLARQVFAHLPYASLEDPLEQAAFDADPRAWLARYTDGAVLDEIQRVPDLPRWLQGMVDRDGRMGRWILTGSQQYQVMDRVTQKPGGSAGLAGYECDAVQPRRAGGGRPRGRTIQLWRSGPGCWLSSLYDRPVEVGRWLGDYIATHVERDVRTIAAIRDLVHFAAFLRLCATRTGQILNLASMAAELGLDAKTARAWLSVLVAGYVVHLLPPHHANLGKRVVKHPKLYLLDSGLACRLLAISNHAHLRAHPSYRGDCCCGGGPG